MPRRSNFGEARVTEKRVQCNAKELAFLSSLPSDSNFDEARVTEKRVQCKRACFFAGIAE